VYQAHEESHQCKTAPPKQWRGPAYHNEAQAHRSVPSHSITAPNDPDLVACVAHALTAGPRLRAVVLKLPTNLSRVEWEALHALPGVRAWAFAGWSWCKKRELLLIFLSRNSISKNSSTTAFF